MRIKLSGIYADLIFADEDKVPEGGWLPTCTVKIATSIQGPKAFCWDRGHRIYYTWKELRKGEHFNISTSEWERIPDFVYASVNAAIQIKKQLGWETKPERVPKE
jgi:hypothetical protein